MLLQDKPLDEVEEKVKHYLWEGIVNPLRKLVFMNLIVQLMSPF